MPHGFSRQIPHGDHSTPDRSGTARTRSGTANHPTRIYVGYGRGARTRTRKTCLGNCRSGPSSCIFSGATWIWKIHGGRPDGQHFAPPLNAMEALETSMIQSVAGLLRSDGIQSTRPFREPHHTASMAAIVGGGKGAKPGEISLAHNGILFLDELPEFPRHVLETLR